MTTDGNFHRRKNPPIELHNWWI